MRLWDSKSKAVGWCLSSCFWQRSIYYVITQDVYFKVLANIDHRDGWCQALYRRLKALQNMVKATTKTGRTGVHATVPVGQFSQAKYPRHMH